MKYIIKNSEPEAFKLWRTQQEKSGQINYSKENADDIWNDLKGQPIRMIEGIHYYSKPQLWAALLVEQGYLCAYCGCRLKNTIRIDHVCPKSKYKTRTFNYRNLVAVCSGEDINGERHCDNSKGSEKLPIKPTDGNCENKFSYDETGIIKEKEGDKSITVDDVLNLNTAFLIEARKNAWKIIKDDIELCSQVEDYDEMDTIISNVYAQNENGEFNEYCFVQLAYTNTLP